MGLFWVLCAVRIGKAVRMDRNVDWKAILPDFCAADGRQNGC